MLLAAWYHTILATIFFLVALLLMLVILLQRGKGVGLAGAFGGAGGHAAFGSKTGDTLTWITVGGAALFLLLSILMNYSFRPETPPTLPASTPPANQPAGAPAGGQGRLEIPADAGDAPKYAGRIFGEIGTA